MKSNPNRDNSYFSIFSDFTEAIPTPSRGMVARHRQYVFPIFFLGLLMLLSLLTSCEQPRPASSDSAFPGGMTPPSSTTVREGDALRINFEAETNLNASVKVQLDGTIDLPLVGNVKAAGKTPPELQAELVKLYKPLVKTSEISVSIAATAASVYVSGAVLRPGRIPMERPLTALDAIMEAGGFDHARAKLSAVTVFRVENGRQQRYHLNLKRTLKGDDPSLFYVKPFDIVHVPEKTFNF